MSHDSTAVFRERVFAAGLGPHYEAFVAAGWSTLAELCFTTSAKPGQDEETFATDVLEKALGDRTHASQGKLRRLFYEAYLITSAGLKRSAEPSTSDVPRQVPTVERDDRRKALALRLPALTVDGKFRGELDVSDRLIDKAIDMNDKNALTYIGLEWCSKREFEFLGGVKNTVLAPTADSRGYVQMRMSNDDEKPISVATDMTFMNAFMRRGLALDMGDIFAWELHEKLRNKMLAALSESPPQGFKRVALEQVFSADRKFWTLMSQETDGKVKRNETGERPCDASFAEVFKSFDFYMTLAPRQGSSAASSREQPKVPNDAAPAATPRLTNAEKKTIKHQLKLEEAKNLRLKPQGAGQQQHQPPGGKGCKKGKNAAPGAFRMPPQLAGMCAKSSAATGMLRLCYGFNLGTCTACGPGKSCQKGLHGCMKPDPATGEACGGPHTCSSCTK